MGLFSIYNFSFVSGYYLPFTKWGNSSITSENEFLKAEQFRNRLYNHLKINYANCDYNVSRLSSDLGLSRAQLLIKCKLLLHQSPIKLIQEYRLEKSREFLGSGIYNVSEAAYLSGFNSLSYFSKSFKKKYRRMPLI